MVAVAPLAETPAARAWTAGGPALKRALLKVLNDETHTRMLGRIEMGQKKPGKNAPYLFSKPDEDDIAAAQAL